MPKPYIFTQEQINDIVNEYTLNNQSLRVIGNKYQVCREVIKRILKNNNVPLRKRTVKYTANYNNFKNIDTPEKAYWLGFIAADGCVYLREDESNASIIINIHEKDKEHLEKFKIFMNSNANIMSHIQTEGFSNNTPMVKIVLNNKEMAYDLIDKGVTPRKSLTLQPPNINPQFYLPFILGYFDGDGSIYTTQQNLFGCSIEGTFELLSWINEILNISSCLEKRDKNSQTNNYYIRCGGTNKPYLILKQLYDSCDVHLERKFKIFQQLETVVLNRNIK